MYSFNIGFVRGLGGVWFFFVFFLFFFFQLLTWTSSGKSVDSTEKSAFKLLKCDLSKTNKDTTPQSREILQTFDGGGTNALASHLTNVYKFSQLEA